MWTWQWINCQCLHFRTRTRRLLWAPQNSTIWTPGLVLRGMYSCWTVLSPVSVSSLTHDSHPERQRNLYRHLSAVGFVMVLGMKMVYAVDWVRFHSSTLHPSLSPLPLVPDQRVRQGNNFEEICFQVRSACIDNEKGSNGKTATFLRVPLSSQAKSQCISGCKKKKKKRVACTMVSSFFVHLPETTAREW